MKEEKKTCEHCKKDFQISETEISLYQKVGIELPAICHFCRVKLHFSFWLFGKFRKGKSDLSGENLITILPEKTRYPIFTHTEWWSDSWEALDHGRDYDPARPFFDQLKDLQEEIPRPHQNGSKNTGCDWSDDVWNSKNCYLSRSMEKCEDLYYSYRNIKVKNSIDATVCFECDRCYDVLDCHRSYRLFYSRHSRDCLDSYFLYDCRNCQNCFMCWNLRGKSYCIENIQYDKTGYEEKLSSFNLGSYASVQVHKKRFEEIVRTEAVHRENQNFKTHNSDGNYLVNTKDCHNCNTISDSEDCYNCVRALYEKSTIDANGCWNSELIGNCSACVGAYAQKYSVWSSSRYSEYLDLCTECEYCFGCVGLKKKRYCILNREYGKEKYERLRERIIADMRKRGEYGQFLPYSMSVGPFNFSTAFTYFPDTKKEDILALGGYWEDIDESHLEGMPTDRLPDNIQDVKDSITTQALICPETFWRFNIAENELSFYRRDNIPLPRFHFDVRTKERLRYLTFLQSHPCPCFYCGKRVYAYCLPEWDYHKIACEECYRQHIS